jgi:DNA polymerase/3'-5' exonuclease PolX
VAGADNAAIAERLETLASLLDLAGSSYYSVRAYRRAAELIRATPTRWPSRNGAPRVGDGHRRPEHASARRAARR